ncbi:MAG: hypothetical protein WBC74_02190 [Candidatus Omnitrophota bacterium]
MSEEKRQEKPAEKPKAAEPGKPSRPTECVACNKSIKKLWYYREGKYFCGKGCWKKSKKAAKEAKEKAEEKPTTK